VNHRGTLVVAFAATFGVILVGAAAVGFVTADGADAPPEIENDQYLDEELINDRTPGEANVEMSSSEPSQTVVIDPGIDAGGAPVGSPILLLGAVGPETADRDVRPLANALIENGHDVRVHTGGGQSGPTADDETTVLGEDLAEADAFVTFRTDYDEAEIDDIETFVEEDGHVLLATDPDGEFDEPGAAALDARLGVTTEPGYVYNMADNDLNYQRVYAEADGSSELTDGVDRVVFPTATPVGTVDGGSAELRPTDGAELSTTRAPTDAPLVVRNDGVVAIGDSDFMSPENAQRADNDVFIGNVADFLVTNDRSPAFQPPDADDEDASADSPPQPPSQPPTEEDPEEPIPIP